MLQFDGRNIDFSFRDATGATKRNSLMWDDEPYHVADYHPIGMIFKPSDNPLNKAVERLTRTCRIQFVESGGLEDYEAWALKAPPN